MTLTICGTLWVIYVDPRVFIAREVAAVSRGDILAKAAAVAEMLLDDRQRSLRTVATEHGVSRSTLSRLAERVKARGREVFRP